MNALSVLSILRSNVALCFWAILLVIGGLLFYALYKKGDVRAMFSHGKTMFELEAKERRRK